MTFLESISLLLKLLHYYNYSTLNNAWYDSLFMILIFISITVLFLLGFAGAWRSIQGLEISSIMNNSTLFTLTYLMGFAFTQVVLYGNFIFTMSYDGLEEINENSKKYQELVFMIFVWIIVQNVYTKEYRSLTKQIERDWFKYEDIQLMGYFRKWQLPPMIGNLYHLLQLLIILSSTTIIYYCMVLNELVGENKDKLNEQDPNWKFERSTSILNLILSFIILIISIIGVWYVDQI